MFSRYSALAAAALLVNPYSAQAAPDHQPLGMIITGELPDKAELTCVSLVPSAALNSTPDAQKPTTVHMLSVNTGSSLIVSDSEYVGVNVLADPETGLTSSTIIAKGFLNAHGAWVMSAYSVDGANNTKLAGIQKSYGAAILALGSQCDAAQNAFIAYDAQKATEHGSSATRNRIDGALRIVGMEVGDRTKGISGKPLTRKHITKTGIDQIIADRIGVIPHVPIVKEETKPCPPTKRGATTHSAHPAAALCTAVP